MRIGIIGSGNFSEKIHSSLISNDRFTIVGGYDSIQLSNFMSFDSLEDLLDISECILIFDILSSNFSMLSEVIKSGKHLYIENPGLCGKRDLRKLAMLAYEAGVTIQVGLKQRFYNFYIDLEKYNITPRIIESSRFNKFNKNSTQLNVIDDLMLHDIDITLKLANSEVKSIYSTAVGLYYNDPDVVNTRIEFYNGCVANLSASKISNKEIHQTKLFQNNTYCSIDYIKQILKVQNNVGDTDDVGGEWGVKTTYNQAKDSDGYLSMLNKEIDSFYNSIANKVEPIAGISQYLQLQSMTDKIKEQLERNFTANV